MTNLEIACFDAESARIAQHSGADRIEFCTDYELGGTTPDFDMLSELKKEITIPLFIMIRPRGGNFVYFFDEFGQMKSAIEKFRKIADGFVFGMLTSEGKIDVERNSELVQMTDLPCTFHRAFDETNDFDSALEDVISCGFQTILTSGGSGNAIDNLENLTELVRKASGRITIMPGGGIRSGNIERLLHTTAVWLHSAAIGENGVANGVEIQEMKRKLIV